MTGLTNINKYNEFLKSRLSKELPGPSAHEFMAPSNRKELIFQNSHKKPRPSSVLIIIHPNDHNEPSVVFIKRVEYDGVHSGQIAFPGGKYEPEDKNLLQTALRETYEEIGIEIRENEIVGKLTDLYVPPSNYIISPYVAVLSALPRVIPDKNEVAEIFFAPLSHFLTVESKTFQQYISPTGLKIDVPGFSVDRFFIWGATAMIFNEFIEIVNEIKKL